MSSCVVVRGFNPVWLFQSKLTDEHYGAPEDFFGISVAIQGDVALVGASQVSPSGKSLALYHAAGRSGQCGRRFFRPSTADHPISLAAVSPSARTA